MHSFDDVPDDDHFFNQQSGYHSNSQVPSTRRVCDARDSNYVDQLS